MTLQIDNKDWLYEQYITLRKTSRQIAKESKCCSATVLKRLRKYNIHVRTNSESKKDSIPWNKGKIDVYSKETLEKMSNAKRDYIPWNKGKKLPHLSGENSINWKGDNASYFSIHEWIRKHYKVPEVCEKCDKEKKLQLSFDHSLGKHTRNIEDYEWLCSKCHLEKDGIMERFIEKGKSTRFQKGHIPWNRIESTQKSGGKLD